MTPVNALIQLLFLVIMVDCKKIQIVEELQNGTEIKPLSMYLKSLAKSLPTSFRIFEDNDLSRSIFVDPGTGIVTVKNRIDRESLCLPDFQINCTIKLKFLMFNPHQSISIDIEITDINDNVPNWNPNSITLNIIEFEDKKFEYRCLYVDRAVDYDAGDNGKLHYYLKEGDSINDNQDFNITGDSLNSQRLSLCPAKVIDKEKVHYYQMVLLAVDNGSPRLTGSLKIKLVVLDKNDNSPIFEKQQYRNDALSEISHVGTRVLTVSATDKDAGDNGNITYKIDDKIASKYFYITKDGTINVRHKLDYDTRRNNFQFLVLAFDKAPEAYRKTGECEVIIKLKDENDEKPEILIHVTSKDPNTGKPTIKENEFSDNFVLAHVQVKDIDFGGKDRVTCSLKENTKVRLEAASSSTNEYQIIALSSFDREEQSQETVEITCLDQAGNKAQSNIEFIITDENDNTPSFSRAYYFTVKENSSNPHKFVGEVRATDKDEGNNSRITYEIVGDDNSYFRIDSSGRIYTQHSLDREEVDKFNLTILAKDGGKPSRTGFTTVLIDVVDINDWPPEFNASSYEFSIKENSQPGSFLGSVTATDRDLPSNTRLRYRIQVTSSMNSYSKHSFEMKPNSDKILSKYNLDREDQSMYLFVVIVEDNGRPLSLTSTTTVRVIVTDVNDNTPIFTTSNHTKLLMQMGDSVGHEVGFVVATDADYGDNAVLDYKIVAGNGNKHFSLNPSTGKLNLAYQFLRPGDKKLVLEACDKGVPKLCSRPLWVFIKITKAHLAENSEGVLQDAQPDSKTYVFIICMLVILLLIILILVICFIIFKNRLSCLQAPKTGRCDSGDVRINETSSMKKNLEIRYHANGTNESILVPTYPSIVPTGSVILQNQNFESTLPHRERQISSDYQSIEGSSPPYNPATTFSWDDSSMQQSMNGRIDPVYTAHRSVKDYYYPASPTSFAVLYNTYNAQRHRSPSYAIRMNNIPKDQEIVQELSPRNASPKRYNSLLNFDTANYNKDTYNYKSLGKWNPKASFV